MTSCLSSGSIIGGEASREYSAFKTICESAISSEISEIEPKIISNSFSSDTSFLRATANSLSPKVAVEL